MSDGTPVSVRLSAELVTALRVRAAASGTTLSDALRDGALMLLGVCPTCGQKAPAGTPEAGKDAARERAG